MERIGEHHLILPSYYRMQILLYMHIPHVSHTYYNRKLSDRLALLEICEIDKPLLVDFAEQIHQVINSVVPQYQILDREVF